MRRVGWGIALWLLAGCGGTTRARPAARTEATEARVEQTRVDIGSLFLPIDAGALPNGARGVLAGGMRYELRDGTWRVARDVVTAPLIGAAPVAGGWRFVDTGGTRWRSGDFLGDLERAGAIEAPIRGVEATGTIAFILEPGLLLSVTDGVSAPRAVLDQPVESAAFLDSRTALALLEGGALARTIDGGATWRRVPYDGVATRVVRWGDAWHVSVRSDGDFDPDASTRPRLVVSRDGSATTRDVPLGALPPFVATDLFGLLRAIASASPGQLAGAANLPFIDGALVVANLDGATRGVLRIDRDGHVVEQTAPGSRGLAALPARGCDVRRWGARAIALCAVRGATESQTTATFVSDDGRAFEPLQAIPAAPWDIVLGDDGHAIVWSVEGTRHLSIDGRERPIRAESGIDSRVMSVHGTRIVAADTPEARLDLVDVESGAATAIVLDALVGSTDGRFSQDGTLVLCGDERGEGEPAPAAADESPPERRLCWIVDDAGRAHRLALPEGVTAVSFADRNRAMAAGANLATLFRSNDGGASWQPLRVPELDHAAEIAIGTTGSPPGVRCFPERCVVSGSVTSGNLVNVVFWGWGEPTRPASRLLVSRPEPSRPTPPESPAIVASLQCDTSSLARAPFRAPRPLARTTTTAEIAGRSGFVRVLAGTTPDAPITLQWWGADGRGPFAASSRTTSAIALNGDPVPYEEHYVALVSRTTAVVDACRGSACVRWVARAGRPITRLTMRDGQRTGGELVVESHDGGLVAADGPNGLMPAHELALTVLEHDATEPANVSFGWIPSQRPWGIALDVDAIALASLSAPLPAGTLRWLVLPTDPQAMPSWWHRAEARAPYRPCAAAATPGTHVVAVPGLTRLRGIEASTLATLELSEAAVCVRSIELSAPPHDRPDIAGRLDARPDGTMAGWVSRPNGVSSAVCRFLPTDDRGTRP